MAWSCLQIIQTACRRIGILAPNAAVTSTDQQIIQLVAICEEKGRTLPALLVAGASNLSDVYHGAC